MRYDIRTDTLCQLFRLDEMPLRLPPRRWWSPNPLRLHPLSRPRNSFVRPFGHSPSPALKSSIRYTLLAAFASASALGTAYILIRPINLDAPPEDEEQQGSSSQRKPTPLSALVRSYVVYTACSIPGLVDWSPNILAACMAVPGLKQLTEAVVRATFFDQFVGGDTAHGTLPVLQDLRAENKGCLFAYSVEVNEAEAEGHGKKGAELVHKRIVEEMIRCIDVAADFEDSHAGERGRGRRTWVAIKLTALLPNVSALTALSKHIVDSRSQLRVPVAFPGKPRPSDLEILDLRQPPASSSLSQQDIEDLKELREDLVRICQRGKERGVRVIVDAEHSWYQPAIDAFGLELMRQFNKPSTGTATISQPLVYVTFQAYLRRNKDYLLQSLEDAKAGGYTLGVKLVRGAYHPHEVRTHSTSGSPNSLSISPDPLPPVWATKLETDECYDECVKILVNAVAKDFSSTPSASSSWFGSSARKSPPTVSVGVLFGTHNWSSVRLVLDELVRNGLGSVVGQYRGQEGESGAESETIVSIPDEVAERVTMAQLYGMCDALTNYAVDRTRSSAPMLLKYVPYGALVEVLPYLSRRAIENKSVLSGEGAGGAARERKEAASGIWRVVFGGR
ncbi:hypothetical protein EIP91_010139 [Steccherinum ochraceum]|uniref:Proline dehydrogenase n=1 Tax=Steccherinum ochraceum TaxID=92696 RepID=A0A4R0RV14_9APHY|nr:hypothetical protein EIP91_010139 [Steccherinum ochraceum]